jgi:hypothetical protein
VGAWRGARRALVQAPALHGGSGPLHLRSFARFDRVWSIERASLVAGALAAVVGVPACARSSKSAPYELVVHVDGDVGHSLAGATISFLGRRVGETDDHGALTLAIRGSEGERVALTVSCPPGFQSPALPTDVVLHRLSEPGRKPEYDLQCPPVTRSVVIVVRADNGPRLPVLYLGKEVARTDESGAAHALVSVPASDDVDITIATNEPGNERLRPQNPSMKFVPSGPDDIKALTVKFALEPDKRRAAVSKPSLPVRLH